MPAYLVTAPAAEPLSLTDAKNFLRVEHGDDDAIITSLVSAARNHVEALTRCALITQTWRLVLDRWPDGGRIAPRIGPLRTLTAVRVFDPAGEASVIDPDIFVVDVAAGVLAAPAWSLPVPGRSVAGIELDIEVGFGAASDVPQTLRQAIRMLVAHWYENRGLIAIGSSVAMMPASVNAMISSHRVLSL
ncbi:putative phiE125 gp8 family phage protein [Afipia massiliensis]|uniref:Putative phiE125 gp8 family phage protein n=1 Tax=Afipia massiliensis TaxID=211460 RepID=A0A840MXV2_9BRAD|nr:head-tail connector protein [Afipia massiliensis]MBB5050548.1 putative phiE125 gp8 family phage protein [Afipia massiliensis]